MNFQSTLNTTIVESYCASNHINPLFLCGNALDLLKEFPPNILDFCMTSPPYWGKREYESGGIGQEANMSDYIIHILNIFSEIKRILKDTGSLWLNLGDTYQGKSLVGLPWRVALAMIDEQNWILRNDVIWNKLKGPDSAVDRLRNTHEYIFHFTKHSKGFYYDIDAIRSRSRDSYISKNGAIVSGTGVTGVRYKRQIELSTSLNEFEKVDALRSLEEMLGRIRSGELSDFRMIIRNQQRTTHSSSTKVSGRAKELESRGFYFLQYHPNGSKPSDVWEILPEDKRYHDGHYATYPEDICRVPILATCPINGIVLDPFCGTGTTNFVAMQMGRKSIGIDLSKNYLDYAQQRCYILL